MPGPERGASPIALPRWLWLPAGLGLAFIALPLVALLVRVDWPAFPGLVTSASARQALWLSVRTSAASTVLCLLLGTPLATVLARARVRGERVIRALVLLPLVLPPVVGGIA